MSRLYRVSYSTFAGPLKLLSSVLVLSYAKFVIQPYIYFDKIKISCAFVMVMI